MHIGATVDADVAGREDIVREHGESWCTAVIIDHRVSAGALEIFSVSIFVAFDV